MAIIRRCWVSTITNRDGVAAFDFATLAGCDQLVVCLTLLNEHPVAVLNEHLSLLVGRYVPTKVILVHNKD